MKFIAKMMKVLMNECQKAFSENINAQLENALKSSIYDVVFSLVKDKAIEDTIG